MIKTLVFNDLLFDGELVTLEKEDVKEIFFDSEEKSYYIENVDGLFYKCKNYKEQ